MATDTTSTVTDMIETVWTLTELYIEEPGHYAIDIIYWKD